MASGNVTRVYMAWRRPLKDKPFCLLVYMANTAKDADAEPWFSLGESTAATLAEMALGLNFPELTGDPTKDRLNRDAVLRKVRRHLTPLFVAGAIRTSRRAVTGRHGVTAATYRLYLDGPAPTPYVPPDWLPELGACCCYPTPRRWSPGGFRVPR